MNAPHPNNMTLFDALVDALQKAGMYNRNDQEAPAAVLWTDKESQWQPVLPRLRKHLPLLTYAANQYIPEERTGPSYWLRCMIARTIEEDQLAPDATPIIYLPGVSRQELRAVDECPRLLQPLAELQYRGTLWTHRNGRDWTIAGFLQAREGGLDIAVSNDGATRETLQRALHKLADTPLTHLKQAAPLKAPFLNTLLNPDEARSILLWLNDPEHYQTSLSPEEWEAFIVLCQSKYSLDPEKQSSVDAAQLLGQGDGAWKLIWDRFAEAPTTYTKIPELLQRARPSQLSLFDTNERWPQDNANAEQQLRAQLNQLDNKHPVEIRAALSELEQEHAPRREWVWARLNMAPLAQALKHLMILAAGTQTIPNGDVEAIAQTYSEEAWKIDDAVLQALNKVEHPDDVEAIQAILNTLYRPWLQGIIKNFQSAVMADIISKTYQPRPLLEIKEGMCLLFSDALRFDIAQHIKASLEGSGYICQMCWSLAALPTVTPTAKPAITPVAQSLTGKGATGLEPLIPPSSTRVSAERLRNLLTQKGYQILFDPDTGDSSSRAWTELGAIDTYGHQHGWRIAHHVLDEIKRLIWRIEGLLEAGWQQVIVVTDHGWLLLPKGLPKAELPMHLTSVRKGRCARLKSGAHADAQTVCWYWDDEVTIAIAPDIHCYESGKEYEHGGISPQECVVPVLSVQKIL
jgi:hypothetical protein